MSAVSSAGVDVLGWATLVGGVALIPVVGFWLALRQDKIRWVREKRAELYVDLLAEARGELEWIDSEIARREVLEVNAGAEVGNIDALAAAYDTRLPPRERSLLGARMAAFATQDVMKAFAAVTAPFMQLYASPTAGGVVRMKVGRAFDALEKQIRHELGASRRSWRKS